MACDTHHDLESRDMASRETMMVSGEVSPLNLAESFFSHAIYLGSPFFLCMRYFTGEGERRGLTAVRGGVGCLEIKLGRIPSGHCGCAQDGALTTVLPALRATAPEELFEARTGEAHQPTQVGVGIRFEFQRRRHELDRSFVLAGDCLADTCQYNAWSDSAAGKGD